MLISLVKDSVLRCFCHTCSVNSAITGHHLQKKPLLKKTNKKPRGKQPKRRRFYHATEIRCEEKSRGGMCYEMVLADPIADKPEQAAAMSPRPKPSVEDINTKLLHAEERRKSMEASRLASVGERLAKLDEASRKREEANLSFIASSQTSLEDKLDTTSSNRESYLNGLRAKVTEHLKGVESVRKQLDDQSDELRETINNKLACAQENREEHVRKFLAKLKDHDNRVQSVRLGHIESIRQLEEKIQSKFNLAETKRIAEQHKKIEVIREHCNKVNEINENRKISEAELSEQIEQQTSAYKDRISKIDAEKEIKRQESAKGHLMRIEQAQEAKQREEERVRAETKEKLSKKFETACRIKEEKSLRAQQLKAENERRAEAVRANKEKMAAAEMEKLSSSG